jgi:hypothetical protein
MNVNTQPVAVEQHEDLVASVVQKLVLFSVACLAGWIVAVILYHAVGWFRSPASQDTSVVASTIKHVLEQIRNTLYR